MTLFCGNLAIGTKVWELEDEFFKFGKCHVDLKGYFAFIEYSSERDAEDALRELRGVVAGQRVRLERKGQRGGGGGGYSASRDGYGGSGGYGRDSYGGGGGRRRSPSPPRRRRRSPSEDRKSSRRRSASRDRRRRSPDRRRRSPSRSRSRSRRRTDEKKSRRNRSRSRSAGKDRRASRSADKHRSPDLKEREYQDEKDEKEDAEKDFPKPFDEEGDGKDSPTPFDKEVDEKDLPEHIIEKGEENGSPKPFVEDGERKDFVKSVEEAEEETQMETEEQGEAEEKNAPTAKEPKEVDFFSANKDEKDLEVAKVVDVLDKHQVDVEDEEASCLVSDAEKVITKEDVILDEIEKASNVEEPIADVVLMDAVGSQVASFGDPLVEDSLSDNLVVQLAPSHSVPLPPATEMSLTKTQIQAMKIPELKEQLKIRELDVKGLKSVLVDRLTLAIGL